MELCKCKETDWQQEMYADHKGDCKHCGKRMPKFAPLNAKEESE